MGAGVGKLTERERDELLQDLKRTVDAIDEKVVNLSIEHGEKLDALSDGLQDLRRDLRDHGMLPEAEPHEATG